jgi:SAM-dependent methyltransferase
MLSVKRIAKGVGARVSRAGLRARALVQDGARFCSACGSAVPGFYRYGGTADWGCPFCKSSPRERFVRQAIESGRLALPGRNGRILHVAPSEASLVALFSGSGATYEAGDIEPEHYSSLAVSKLDLCAFVAEAPYDLIYCSHVLEHVFDDAQALRNIRANLVPGGEAWIIVPLHAGPTEDGPADLPAAERERRFGQWDHVRQYGPDIAARMQAASFAVERVGADDLSAELRGRHGLDSRDILWRCRAVPA